MGANTPQKSETSETCDCSPSMKQDEENKPEDTFNEGMNITMTVEGDKGGGGCSFQFKQTCCYIHKAEDGEERKKRLCHNIRQSDKCRGKDEYELEEIDGNPGSCRLTLYDAK